VCREMDRDTCLGTVAGMRGIGGACMTYPNEMGCEGPLHSALFCLECHEITTTRRPDELGDWATHTLRLCCRPYPLCARSASTSRHRDPGGMWLLSLGCWRCDVLIAVVSLFGALAALVPGIGCGGSCC
jgi:hypothetical protein